MSKYLKVAPYKKRKLRSGDWIIISSSGNPLVIDAHTLRILCNKEINSDIFELHFIELLKEEGFLVDIYRLNRIPEEPTSFKFKFFSFLMLAIGGVSLLGVVYYILYSGLPFSKSINLLAANPILGVIILVIFSILTTFLHEVMHLIYSNSLKSQDNKINISMTKAVATVSMTHIWTWSLIGRIVAIVSGICLDLLILFIVFFFNQRIHFEYSSLLESILITRIVWQFRVQNKTDIRLFIELVRDDPFLFEKKTVSIKIINFLGFLVNILIILIWLVPLSNYLRM
ncbi:hypothetical protein [Enterococcus asini]|uniref:hypothetical protein n=1 Tax=Enterococcus asini TaxID=57732 RepID=UPI001E400800|nr:hypothetical protein [Enterococcus asini]